MECTQLPSISSTLANSRAGAYRHASAPKEPEAMPSNHGDGDPGRDMCGCYILDGNYSTCTWIEFAWDLMHQDSITPHLLTQTIQFKGSQVVVH